MSDSATPLSWAIGAYIAVKVLGYSTVVATAPSLQVLFVLAPISLLAWQAFLLRARCVERGSGEISPPFYESFESGDWWRVFWILWIGHTPLASEYLWGFFLFSGLAALLICVCVFTASVEFARKNTATPLAIACLAFAYFLASWEKNSYVVHYGVPIVGHFLEKPEYHAKYRVEVARERSGKRFQAVADIHVKGRTETEEVGEGNWFGRSIEHTYKYRDVWVKKIYMPDGGIHTIDVQDEPLHLGQSVLLTDAHGRSWYVRLLNEPIP